MRIGRRLCRIRGVSMPEPHLHMSRQRQKPNARSQSSEWASQVAAEGGHEGEPLRPRQIIE